MSTRSPGRFVQRRSFVSKDPVDSVNSQLISVDKELDERKCDEIEQFWSSLELHQGPKFSIPQVPTTNDDALVDFLKVKIRARIFSVFPLRVIRLPGMKLMERNDVALYIIQNKLKDLTYKIQHKLYYSAEDSDPISALVEEVTKFAVLSHMWGQDEPSHEDFLRERNITTSEKYEKLREFCRIAHQHHGVGFAWADTVCINKLSSSELDESIRSMFVWYHESSICIIYLADTDTFLNFPSDKWFTRGWTLQELLAPLQIKFYNKRWEPLTSLHNDKLDSYGGVAPNFPDPEHSFQLRLLCNGVSIATGIPIRHVYDFKPGLRDPPFPERMKWIARRKTTKPEDMVYSMMGVLGVSIPVAYGEGIERAVYRLFRAALEVDWDLSWFLWGGKPVLSHIHPSRMVPSSPACYSSWRDPLNDETWRLPELDPRHAIALTNTGLPIKVLVVPVKVGNVHRTTHDQPRDVSATITCPVFDHPIEVNIPHLDPLLYNFALGILHHFRRAPRRVYAILLRRIVTGSLWERLETKEMIFFDLNDRFYDKGMDVWTREIKKFETGWRFVDSSSGPKPEIGLVTLCL